MVNVHVLFVRRLLVGGFLGGRLLLAVRDSSFSFGELRRPFYFLVVLACLLCNECLDR